MEQRREPYVWPTWIVGLLSGDKHCEWAAWFRAHYIGYEKLEDPNAGSLVRWKSDHAEAVRVAAEKMRAEGWKVYVENQNKFSYKGQAATVGGCPDIVAVKPGILRIVDVKTGKERDADAWQVALYGFLMPLVDDDYGELVVDGVVSYKDRERTIVAQDIISMRVRIIERIKRTAAWDEPKRTPSPSECAFCDIACCPDRVLGDGKSAKGDAF